jgi:hypothetical protein
MLNYLHQVEDLSYTFIGLVAEALGLPSDGLSHFFEAHDVMMHRSKVCHWKYVVSITIYQYSLII